MVLSSLSTANNFFNFTKICFFCKKESRTFKTLLSCYSSSSSSQCILTEEEKVFMCSICCSVNPLDFTQMCNKYTAKILQKNNLILERVEIEQALIKLKLQENK